MFYFQKSIWSFLFILAALVCSGQQINRPVQKAKTRNFEPFEFYIKLKMGGSQASNSYTGSYNNNDSFSKEYYDDFWRFPCFGLDVDWANNLLHFQAGVNFPNYYRIRLSDPAHNHYSSSSSFFHVKSDVVTFQDDAYYRARTFDFPIKFGIVVLDQNNPENPHFKILFWGGYVLSIVNNIHNRNVTFKQFRTLNVDKDLSSVSAYTLGTTIELSEVISLGLDYQKSLKDFFRSNPDHDWVPGLVKFYIGFTVY
jgi:hypothetical protein